MDPDGHAALERWWFAAVDAGIAGSGSVEAHLRAADEPFVSFNVSPRTLSRRGVAEQVIGRVEELAEVGLLVVNQGPTHLADLMERVRTGTLRLLIG